MRGAGEGSGSLFNYVDLEARVGRDHPLRTSGALVYKALGALAGAFTALPEKLLRAMLLKAFYSIHLERQLMERLEFDLLPLDRLEEP